MDGIAFGVDHADHPVKRYLGNPATVDYGIKDLEDSVPAESGRLLGFLLGHAGHVLT